jgi:PEP-CTERM motif
MRKRNPLHFVALAAIALAAAMNPGTADAGSVYVAGSGNEFGTLDLSTGNFSYIGTLALPSNDNIYGMGFGADHNLYGLDSQTGTGGAHLWQIDTATAGVTDLSPSGIGQTAIDATADASGKMYALTQDANAVFYTLSPPSTTVNVVGATGIGSTGLMAVNASGTQIFTGSYDPVTGTTDLYSVNPTTGAATLIGDTGFYIINGLFVNGTLYGFDDNTEAIVTINTTTGVATQVATYNTGGNPGLGTPNNPGAGDVIFASAVPQSIPEPSSIVMGLIALAAGGSLGLLRRRPATPTA